MPTDLARAAGGVETVYFAEQFRDTAVVPEQLQELIRRRMRLVCQFRENYDLVDIQLKGLDGFGLDVVISIRVELDIHDIESYRNDLKLLTKSAHKAFGLLKHPVDED